MLELKFGVSPISARVALSGSEGEWLDPVGVRELGWPELEG
jgi:hypothetical protein